MSDLLFLVVGYLAGSIPFGLLLTRAAGLGDVRKIGSGNIGATNVLRTGNSKIAALTLLCDGLKGFLPVLAAHFWGSGHAGLLAGFAALAGHIFPVWLQFKGGKGVATGLGVFFAWNWMIGLVFVFVWACVFTVTRISSAAALSAVVLAVPAAYFASGLDVAAAVLILAAVIWLTHRANIARLLKGEEPTSSFSKPK
jgi:acyl phosphate:glycerol-3-phosphate acyltransferase